MAWYVKFDDLYGSSTAHLHLGWCNAANVQMASRERVGGGAGVGASGGRFSLNDISVGILSDKTAPRLLEAAVKGKVFKKVEIHGTAKSGENEWTYVEIELTEALITSYQLGVLDNSPSTDDILLSLSFDKYKVVYRENPKSGTP